MYTSECLMDHYSSPLGRVVLDKIRGSSTVSIAIETTSHVTERTLNPLFSIIEMYRKNPLLSSFNYLQTNELRDQHSDGSLFYMSPFRQMSEQYCSM